MSFNDMTDEGMQKLLETFLERLDRETIEAKLLRGLANGHEATAQSTQRFVYKIKNAIRNREKYGKHN